MVTPITMGRCQICGQKFYTFEDANHCESSVNIDEPNYEVGDELDFEDESTMFGSRYCYSSNGGKIIHKEKVFNKQKMQHQTIYFVDGEYAEYGVLFVEGEHGPKMFSPAEYKYQPGTAQQAQINSITWRYADA